MPCWNEANRVYKFHTSDRTESNSIGYIGSGSFRKAYVCNGSVYKVSWNLFDNVNQIEHRFFTAFRDRDWSCHSHLYRVHGAYIMCMPYYDENEMGHYPPQDEINNTIYEISRLYQEWSHANGIPFYGADVEGNWLIYQGKFKLVDAGGSR